MDSDPDNVSAQTKDHHAGAAQSALGQPQPEEYAAGCGALGEPFSILAELAKDPANGLEEIRPGMYRCRKDSNEPDR
jgi:hypothetical protein